MQIHFMLLLHAMMVNEHKHTRLFWTHPAHFQEIKNIISIKFFHHADTFYVTLACDDGKLTQAHKIILDTTSSFLRINRKKMLTLPQGVWYGLV